jgi:hypothetical protein
LNQLDLGVDAFQPGVRQAELDGGEDRVDVCLDPADQVSDGGIRLRLADVHHRFR